MAGAFGAFGKIPALGDFFRLNVRQAFVQAWDAWLQAALLHGREEYGSDWTDRYMSAPIWRFVLAPGLAGPDAAAGVFMPSVDRVGRQFPLTLVAPVPDDPPLRTLTLQETAFTNLELVALDSLEDGMTRDALAARLDALELTPRTAPSMIRENGLGCVVTGTTAQAMLPDLALRDRRLEVVFSAEIEGQARLLGLHGLPGRRASAALFDPFAALWSEGLT